jgi:prolyl oligopeptidase
MIRRAALPLSLALLSLAACGGATPPAPPLPPVTTAPAAQLAPPAQPTAALPPWASLYPSTRTVDQRDTLFGTEVRDPYRWLEDGKSPEVQAWLAAQDKLARAKLDALPDRAAILARLKELSYVDSQTTPVSRGGRLFYTRRAGTQEKSVLYFRSGKAGAEHLLIDPSTWSTDGSSSLHEWSVSWDGKRIAYKRSENNSDEATMYVMEVDTGKVSTVDVIPGAKYAYASWLPTNDGFYYTRLPVDPSIPVDARPGYREVRFHKLGADPAKDELVHDKTGDPTLQIGGWVSRDGHWLFFQLDHGWRSNDLAFRDLRKPGSKGWTNIIQGTDALYDVTAYKDRFYVHTNDGAPNWRVFAVDPAHPERAAWKEIVAERPDATLDGMLITGGTLALTYLKDVTSRVELHDLGGKLIREVPLPALGSAELSGDADQDEAFYSFETYNYPSEIHSLSVKKGNDSVWFKLKVPADPSAYVVEQLFFQSKDGTRVPMFVVRGKSTPRDGSAPAYLTGYGGFNSSETPTFRKGIFPWLERGGIYAVANMRGGGEYGEGWHRAGMKHDKQHVFDDFEAAAEALVKEKLTSADRLVAFGASNGGLLMGAVLTQRPDLFRAVICAVPLLDMVRYQMSGSGRTWTSEYGSADDEADFRALYAYSPVHHVTPGTPYPSVLMDTADSDDRVDPMHARKMAAALQAASSGGPVLLRVEHNSGHGGADLVRALVERQADWYAFALSEIRKTGATMGPATTP